MAFAAIGASCSPRTSVLTARMPALRIDSSSPRGDHEVAQRGTAAFICCKFVLIFKPKFLMYQFCFIVFVSCGSVYVTQHKSVQSAETLISSAQLRTVIGVLSSAKSAQPTEYLIYFIKSAPDFLYQLHYATAVSTEGVCY